MVDRIDKTANLEPWRVQEATSAKKDSNSGEQDGSKDAFAALHEKTDWHLLFEKSRLWKQNIQVGRDEIAEVLFQKINLKTDPSLLRVDIILKDGGKISPAFVSVSRGDGFKIKNLTTGKAIPPELILRDNFLRITIPADPKMFAQEEVTQVGKEKPKEDPEETTITKFLGTRWPWLLPRDPQTKNIRTEMLLIYGVSIVALALVIGGLLFLR